MKCPLQLSHLFFRPLLPPRAKCVVSVLHIKITEQGNFANPECLISNNTTGKREAATILGAIFLTNLHCFYWVYIGNKKTGQNASGYLLIYSLNKIGQNTFS